MSDRTRTPAARRIVRLDLEPGEDPLRGLVDRGDGDWRPFWGWLELMQAIDDATAAPNATSGERQGSDR